jgi:predicted acylesterase/phospholipase RssA
MTHQTKGIDLVLGAGGVKGFGHIGVLRALHDLKVEIGSVTGVSVGSLIAAMYTNGLSLDQIFAEMYNGRRTQRSNDSSQDPQLSRPHQLHGGRFY